MDERSEEDDVNIVSDKPAKNIAGFNLAHLGILASILFGGWQLEESINGKIKQAAQDSATAIEKLERTTSAKLDALSAQVNQAAQVNADHAARLSVLEREESSLEAREEAAERRTTDALSDIKSELSAILSQQQRQK